MNISETSKISLDIKALIGMIIGIITVASIWFNLTAEIELLKIKVSKMDEKVQSNYTWVNNFEPPKQVQKAVDEINLMKLENAVLKYKVEQLQKNKWQSKKLLTTQKQRLKEKVYIVNPKHQH